MYTPSLEEYLRIETRDSPPRSGPDYDQDYSELVNILITSSSWMLPYQLILLF